MKTLRNEVKTGWVETEDHYRDVLKLRAKSYTWVAAEEKEREACLRDDYDLRCRIFRATYQGRTIGSFRNRCPEAGELLAHAQYLPIPGSFPAAHQILETSRLCTDPEFRGADLVYVLIREIVLSAFNAQRSHIVSSCQEKLIPLYLKIGATVSDESFDIPAHNIQGVRLILFDVRRMMTGRNIDLTFWNAFLKEPIKAARRSGAIQLTWRETLNIFFIAPIHHLVRTMKGKL